MNTHYICRGECQGLSTTPGICKDNECSRSGKTLELCTCADGSHNSLREDDSEEEED